jgi:uncharacterized protein involved in response to NO
MNAVPRLSRDYAGPALLSYGFRPFFLLGPLYAALAMFFWLSVFYGWMPLASAFAPRDWHAHELLYGYLPAVITGFLLTAVPNWTGRLPLQGTPLLILVLAWVAGRLAINFSAALGALAATLIDSAFLFLVAAATAREIIAGNNWRNLKVLAPVLLLGAGNIFFHVEAYVSGLADVSIRAGQAVVLLLIMIIGGRVIPSFTRNWLARQGTGRLPASFGRFDALAIALSAAALVLWIIQPSGIHVAAGLLTAAGLQSARLVRWAGDRTLADRLVLVLHLGYAFVPFGFLLSALAALDFAPPSAGTHAWMAGAAGIMTLAVMSRATLGHTGRPLAASPGTQAVYAAALIAAGARTLAALMPASASGLLHLAFFAWIGAFGGFCLLYGPMLLRPRLNTAAPPP